MRKRRSFPMVAAFDLLIALVAMFLIIALTETPKVNSSSVKTYGAYAVVMTWPPGSNNDMDLWVEDPAGHIVFYASRDGGFLHLETDDLGTASSGTVIVGGRKYVSRQNSERTIIKQTIPGEYTVNGFLFTKWDLKPIQVRFEVWSVTENHPLAARTLTFRSEGQELTAFRFKVDRSGNIISVNRIPKKLAQPEYSGVGG